MNNISSIGLKVTITTSVLYPQGITITKFADDGDSLNVQESTIVQTAMGPNGHMVRWLVPVAPVLEVNVIPGTEECDALEAGLKANMVQENKRALDEIVTIAIHHPDGRTDILSNGTYLAGKVSQDYSANGRAKSRTFRFQFARNVN